VKLMSMFRISVGRARVALLGLGLVGLLLSPACPASSPTQVLGPATIQDEAPFMEFLSPTSSFSVSRGDSFEVTWRDSDTDSSALIKLEMVNAQTNVATVIVEGIQEDDLVGPDNWIIDTTLLAEASYYIRGTISDAVNAPYVTYALISGGAGNRVVVTVTPPGLAPSNVPPQVVVVTPEFNQSVAQDDTLVVTVAPVLPANQTDPATIPYDPDSTATIYIVADLDNQPTNDNVRDPQPDEVIVLRTRTVEAGATAVIEEPIVVDLVTLPPRANGEPYYIRATIDDGQNPQVHSYAAGTVNVARTAQGTILLEDVGRSLAGVRWVGFNPGARLGTTIEGVGDFDADGVDDFVLVAQFGNPRNFGNIGEAYIIYGLDGRRFGGSINVNSVSTSISGAIVEAPVPRSGSTLGIKDVGVMPDMDGDGRPELMFGLPFVDGIYQQRDMDLSDGDGGLGCYPDFLPNNLATQEPGIDTYLDSMGSAVLVGSQNRDSDPSITGAPRLESTIVGLEFAGMTTVPAGTGGTQILARAPSGKLEGLRVQVGVYDFVDHLLLNQPPIQDLMGWNVASMPDMNNNNTPEMILSAPGNEQDILDTLATFGFFATHVRGRTFGSSIIVIDGAGSLFGDFMEDEDSNANVIPIVNPDHPGKCDETDPEDRRMIKPFQTFEIYAEDPEDFLHDGSYAGDFNQDAVPDILCGAPFNDRSPTLPETGATYVLYGRTVYGDYFLEYADDEQFRAPMLRIRGEQPYDRVGWVQKRVADVNGDGIDDIVLGAPYADFGGVRPAFCDGDWDKNGRVDQTDLGYFNGCRTTFGDEVFYNDECKLDPLDPENAGKDGAWFDFNNDRQINDDDRRVMDCLTAGGSVECCPADNGFVGIVFGGVSLDGDRSISQIGTSQLPGARFVGTRAGDLAGWDVASAGDFNRDGYGDILIAAPGEYVTDDAGRTRMGAAYLIFGGPHLYNRTFTLAQVGTDALPGIKMVSPFERSRPDEAPIETVSGIGDINNDGFADIGVGIPRADFVDWSFPQDPSDPAVDPGVGRRTDGGDVYMIYGSNVGTNR
jgi:hypothetical protein